MSDIRDYPIIQFVDKTSNFNKRKKCIRVNDYLVLAYCDSDQKSGSPIKIYKLKTGLPLLDVKFISPSDALRVAEWITETFGEYFVIWDQYPEADIFGMTKWTVEDGIRKYEALQDFSKHDRATANDLRISYDLANSNKWFNEHLR